MGDLIESFWTQQCPGRGPSLSHAHSERCDITTRHPGLQGDHLADQCCHCGERAADWYRTQERLRDQTTPPAQVGWPGHQHIWQSGKCATCPVLQASLPAPKPMDDVLVEPKAITGKGPEGPVRGQERRGEPAYGRMPFTLEDGARLQFFLDYCRKPAVDEGNAYLDAARALDAAPLGE